MVPLLMIEQAFLPPTSLKIPEGGWLPLVIAAVISLVRSDLGARLAQA